MSYVCLPKAGLSAMTRKSFFGGHKLFGALADRRTTLLFCSFLWVRKINSSAFACMTILSFEKCTLRHRNVVYKQITAFSIGEFSLSPHSPIPVMRSKWEGIKFQIVKYSSNRLPKDFVKVKFPINNIYFFAVIM